MKYHLRALSVVLVAMVGLLGAAEQSRAEPFSAARIIIEVNASAEDGGIQIFVDGRGMEQIPGLRPQRAGDLRRHGQPQCRHTGVTELFFESAEPSFHDLPLDQLLVRFPAGKYRFEGVTVGGKLLTAQPTLKPQHSGGSCNRFAARRGDACPHRAARDRLGSGHAARFRAPRCRSRSPATKSSSNGSKPSPLIKVDVTLPATVTPMTVPAEFLQRNADYIFEVLAIEESGNQTITEGSFKTAP